MILGIDIDGVLNNFQDVAAKYIKEDYNVIFNPHDYELYKGLTGKQVKQFSIKHKQHFLDEVMPLDNSQQILKQLKEDGHTVYLITARYYMNAEETIEWLNKHGFVYDDIFFQCGDKVDACKYKKVEIMIDDSPHNLISLAQNDIPYIVFDQLYNKNIYGELYRSEDWNKIYDFLNFYSVE